MQVSLSSSSAASALASVRTGQTGGCSRSGDGSGFSTGGMTPMGGPPPPPPGDFGGLSMSSGNVSTAQFAMQRQGPPPGGDPVAALDSDGDGNVSAEEFGIDDSASTAMKDLFSAMDSDSDGQISETERDSFRESFMATMDAKAQAGEPLPPPPGGQGQGNAHGFVQQLAQIYASWGSDSGSTSTGSSWLIELLIQ